MRSAAQRLNAMVCVCVMGLIVCVVFYVFQLLPALQLIRNRIIRSRFVIACENSEKLLLNVDFHFFKLFHM